ncbi:ABC transporter ATP-binding protein [Phycisphaeraceae bacterium D3-23]
MNDAMIQLDAVSHRYDGKHGRVDALADVSLSFAPGELALVTGPSGSGKSTLLLAVGAMRRPTSGAVSVHGTDLYAMSAAGRARFRAERIGFVFQTLNLIPYLSAVENVLLAAPPEQQKQRATRDRAETLLAELGLADRMRHKPGELSQGERQRAAIARAMLNQPKVILADEPSGNLDPDNAHAAFAALRAFADAGGTALVATHSTLHDDAADRVVTLRGGVVAPGTGQPVEHIHP